ncbi:hypothetical protein [Spirillospora sp. NBC_01491]|uniref:hypothetical protein n=1 Tax=Spirillospora sp. NBC_01491 TaxID=2976007 RepID=UPI002E302931|nr:hypothetical protein [Spirillospora sp. NBC_01491]
MPGAEVFGDGDLVGGGEDAVRVEGFGEGQWGKREAMTSSKPRSSRCRAKKSGDMVMTAECSPRARMSAQTSAMPLSQVAVV